MKKRFLYFVALYLACAGINAAPSVSGNTITWPDDGWYQVQVTSDDGIAEVCQGGRFCEVVPGEYIVINHTTNERFEGIFVTGSDEPGGITVTGNVISWPDDGWYQVQDDTTYVEVCAGTRSCTVEAGSYVVINHTTGQRFEGIEVGEADGPENPIVVTDNIISWPDDGWYQVQSADDYSNLCEGGLSCQAAAGRYIVINHTSGERWEVVIDASGTDEPVRTLPSSLDLSALSQDQGALLYRYQHGTGNGVTGIGDVNVDGLSDLLFDSFTKEITPGIRLPSMMVLFGSSDPLPILSNSPDPSSVNGFFLPVTDYSQRGISKVSQQGDINGDGVTDFVISDVQARANQSENAGRVYVVLGQEDMSNDDVLVEDLSGTDGFTLNGFFPFNEAGSDFSWLGDVNGDGYDDLGVVTDRGREREFSNELYVIYGRSDPFPANADANSDDVSDIALTYNLGNCPGIGGSGDLPFEQHFSILFGSTDAAIAAAAIRPDIAVEDGIRISGVSSAYSLGDLNGDSLVDYLLTAQGMSGSYILVSPDESLAGNHSFETIPAEYLQVLPAYAVFDGLVTVEFDDDFVLLGDVTSLTIESAPAPAIKRVFPVDDFNGDGFQDVVIEFDYDSSGFNQVYVLYGYGP